MNEQLYIEIPKQRDYRLRYNFDFCPTCEMLGLRYDVHCKTYIHRTKKEVEAGITHNINAMCPKGHIFKPQKYCTKCGFVYNHELTTCDICEPELILRVEKSLGLKEK